MLDVRYRDGIVVGALGFPYWTPYARAVVELPPPSTTRTVDEMRVLDVLIANEVMARTGDPLWEPGDRVGTPQGWTWAHAAMTRQIALVPAEFHSSFRHLGGVSTMKGAVRRRGLDVGGAAPVRWQSAESLSEEAVEKVENHAGYRFPAAYRAFLATTNGGRPHVPAVHPRFGFVADQQFFGMVRDDLAQDLIYARGWFVDRLTADYLAVGYVQGGLIVVKVRGPDVGSVWYYDDDDPRDADDYDAAHVSAHLLHRCADDFDTFWRALRAVPYPLRWLAQEIAANGDAGPVTPDGMGTGLPRTKRPAAGEPASAPDRSSSGRRP